MQATHMELDPLWNQFTQDREHLSEKYRQPDFRREASLFGDQSRHESYMQALDARDQAHTIFRDETGMDNRRVAEGVTALIDGMEGQPHPLIKARAVAYVMENTRIEMDPRDWFGVNIECWHKEACDITARRWEKEILQGVMPALTKRMRMHNEAGSLAMYVDFCHSVPDWDRVLSLGFSGLQSSARAYRAQKEAAGTLTEKQRVYYEAIEIEYDAIAALLGRLLARAEERAAEHPRMAHICACLRQTMEGPPRNTYEALMLIYLYHFLSEYIEGLQVRSLGNLDQMLAPFYARDLADGVYTVEQIRELLRYFLFQYQAIGHRVGHPTYLGGTGADGQSLIGEMTFLILDTYDEIGIFDPKLHIKVAQNTPDAFLEKALDMVRRGNSSMIFICEETAVRAMRRMGATEEEARTFATSGCNEYHAKGKEVGTAPMFVNMAKLIDLVLHNGVDPKTGLLVGCETGDCTAYETFEEFYAAYKRQLAFVLWDGMRIADAFEAHIEAINPAPMFSATSVSSLQSGRDGYADGAKYNITAVLVSSPATAVDSLMMIRKYVYELREVDIATLRAALDANWTGYERLRARLLRDPEKFGNNLDEPDAMAVDLCELITRQVNHRPNARGGFYKCGMHSSDFFITFGMKTRATPDGRREGESLSKNISPVSGMDRRGLTAMLQSATKIDSSMFPTNFSVDFMMHPSAAAGREGLAAMLGMLRAYMAAGGAAIHGNVLDGEVLRAAQKDPEAYRNLQIRLCGWNVLFRNLSRPEQDAFIEASERPA